MKQDIFFARAILVDIEEGRQGFTLLSKQESAGSSRDGNHALDNEVASKLKHHLDLLRDAGLVEFNKASETEWIVQKMTRKGYEFLDITRDPKVWQRALSAASKAGVSELELIGELAKGLVQTKTQKPS